MSYDFSESELDALDAYVKRGVMPPPFMHRVLQNDLIGAVAYATKHEEAFLAEFVISINLRLPNDIWGSPEKVLRHWEKFNKHEGEDDGSQD